MQPPKKKKKHILRTILLTCILAVCCVAGVELAVCRVQNPTVYHQIVDPAAAFLHQVQNHAVQYAGAIQDCAASCLRSVETWGTASIQALSEHFAALSSEPTPPPEEELEQAAEPPAIQETLVPADYTITELTTQDDFEVLTGGNVTIQYFNQADEVWAEQPYGRDHIGKYGCGPTAMAMVVSSLTQVRVNPAEMAVWADEAGYCATHKGSRWSIVPGAAEHFGLSWESLSPETPEELRESLANGGLAVALMGAGHFTRHGHFILLRGVTLTGEILVADPNSRENSLALWDPQLILDELASGHSSGGPLWLVTVSESF